MAGSILTASAFNQLGQYTSIPGRRGYYAELAIFFLNGGRNHRQYSLRLPTEGWPCWIGLGGWLRSEIVYLPRRQSPIPVLTGLDVDQLRWSRPTRYHCDVKPSGRFISFIHRLYSQRQLDSIRHYTVQSLLTKSHITPRTPSRGPAVSYIQTGSGPIT